MMTKLDAALLKLEGALDYTTDPQIRNLIDVAQQAIEAAKQVTADKKFQLIYAAQKEVSAINCTNGYQRAA